jgi:Transcriptional activator, adenine-specific DNA methyltransferase
MGRPPRNPTGPMTASERQARRRKRVGKSINRRRRTLYKIANESETRKAKRTRRAEIGASVAARTAAATALSGSAMPPGNVIYLDPPWPHDNYSAATGSDRSTDNHYAPMTWEQLDAFGAKLPAAPDCMLIMWVSKPNVVRASAMLIKWGWDPFRTTEMVWLKMQEKHPDKIETGTGKRLRDQHEPIIIAVRGTIPPALPMWGSVLIAPVGGPSEKPKALAEMIDRDYGPQFIRIEMFARPPFDRRGWWFWGDATPGGLLYVP